ncbi:MAG: fibronectin type III domain-containing protein [Oscillospiraceae bacterium]|nr:fibronectin type III domain-containing protein [Oscillospiraceae bacterium]
MKQQSFRKKLTTALITMSLLAAATLTPMTALAANNNPSGSGHEYVMLWQESSGSTAIYRGDGEAYKVSGVTYNKKTNTLTLNNVKAPDKMLEINEMGENFTIVLKGTNTLGTIQAFGYGYGGSVRLSGTGSLTLNKNKAYRSAILVQAESGPAKLTIDKGVKLTAYAAKGYDAFAITKTTCGTNALNITGTTSIKNTGKVAERTTYRAMSTQKLPLYVATPRSGNDGNKYCVQKITTAAGAEQIILKKIVTDPTYGDFAVDATDKFGNALSPFDFETSDTEQIWVAGGSTMYLDGYTNKSDPKGMYGVLKSGSSYYVYKVKESTVGLICEPVKDQQGVKSLPSNYKPLTSGKTYYNYSYGGTTYTTPAATAISKLTASKKAFTVSWKKVSSISGYQVSYSTSSSFKTAKTITVSKDTTAKKLTSLSANKKYYVRVRTYKTIDGAKVYSNWSSAKAVTTK